VVLFLATLEGQIHKYAMTADDRYHTACLLEVIHVTPTNQPQPIRTLALLRRQVRAVLLFDIICSTKRTFQHFQGPFPMPTGQWQR